MQISVRLGSGLSQYTGSSRLQVNLPEGGTVADLIESLRDAYPSMRQRMDGCVAIISGRHVSPAERLLPGEEVAFLIPISGGQS
ncbi:MAG: MoaD/ThiS family protein [Anaerolineales bacterium]|jgi:molybdopterin converting factor small subunit